MRSFLGSLALALGVAVSAPSLAADRAIIVLDASGSMWGQIDGKPKLEIARETLAAVLPTLPADMELGFMAYGHRQKGVCSDIQLIVPPAVGTAGAIAAAAAKLKFLGKTPLTEAVRQAAEALRYTEDKATVILITDGIETCGGDPCALGRELEQHGVDFTAHVVGFGLTRDEGHQVACLAENTGGRYIQAKDAGELAEALKETVAAAPAKKPEPAKLPQASVATTARPTIGQSFPVTWTGPAGPGDYVDIVPAGDREIGSELAYSYVDGGSPLAIRAPGKPGKYDLRYVWEGPERRHVLATVTIDVGDAEVALLAPASVPVGKAFDVRWKGPGRAGDYIDIVPEGYGEFSGELSYFYVESGNPARIRAPGKPGNYRLRYVLEAPDGRKMLASVPLKVVEAHATLAFPPTAVAGTGIDVAWTGPAADGDYVDLVPDGYDEFGGELSYFYIASSPDGETGTLKAPGDAGRYLIRYVLEAPDGRRVLASQPIRITPAVATIKAPEAVETGTQFAVEFTGPAGAGDYLDLVPAGNTDTGGGELAYFYVESAPDGKTATLTAPDKPGSYDIRYVLEAAGGRRIVTRVPITVQ